MRPTPLMVTMTLLAGCATDPTTEVQPRSQPLPSAASVQSPGAGPGVPSAEIFWAAPMRGGCRTRYDFAGDDTPADATTTLVGGDPLHWTTSYPGRPGLPRETETQVDAAGHLLFRRTAWLNSELAESFRYDAAGRLAGYSVAPTEAQPDGPTATVDAYNAAGLPTHVVFSGGRVVIAGRVVPGSETGEGELGYDEHDRLTSLRWRMTGVGALSTPYYDEHIVYDDAAGRIDREVDVDGTAFGTPGIGVNTGYQLFDDANRQTASHWVTPGDPPTDSAFTYDDDGRLLTTAYDDHATSGTRLDYLASEIYTCP